MFCDTVFVSQEQKDADLGRAAGNLSGELTAERKADFYAAYDRASDPGGQLMASVFSIAIGGGLTLWSISVAKKRKMQSAHLAETGSIPAMQLEVDFRNNEIAAKAKYKGCRVNIYGTITKIDARGVELDSWVRCQGSGFGSTGFSQGVLMTLNTGDLVYVSGICKGKFVRVSVKDCTIQKNQVASMQQRPDVPPAPSKNRSNQPDVASELLSIPQSAGKQKITIALVVVAACIAFWLVYCLVLVATTP